MRPAGRPAREGAVATIRVASRAVRRGARCRATNTRISLPWCVVGRVLADVRCSFWSRVQLETQPRRGGGLLRSGASVAEHTPEGLGRRVHRDVRTRLDDGQYYLLQPLIRTAAVPCMLSCFSATHYRVSAVFTYAFRDLFNWAHSLLAALAKPWTRR